MNIVLPEVVCTAYLRCNKPPDNIGATTISPSPNSLLKFQFEVPFFTHLLDHIFPYMYPYMFYAAIALSCLLA